MQLTEDMIRYPLTDEAGVARPFDVMQAAFREQELRAAREQLKRERRARNTYALLALVGWVVVLALLGHGGAV